MDHQSGLRDLRKIRTAGVNRVVLLGILPTVARRRQGIVEFREILGCPDRVVFLGTHAQRAAGPGLQGLAFETGNEELLVQTEAHLVQVSRSHGEVQRCRHCNCRKDRQSFVWFTHQLDGHAPAEREAHQSQAGFTIAPRGSFGLVGECAKNRAQVLGAARVVEQGTGFARGTRAAQIDSGDVEPGVQQTHSRGAHVVGFDGTAQSVDQDHEPTGGRIHRLASRAMDLHGQFVAGSVSKVNEH